METAGQTKLAIADQYVLKTDEGVYEGAWYQLVVVTEDGTKLSNILYEEEE